MTGGVANFGDVVRRHADAGRLVVQPRMGLASPTDMRAGLVATRDADAATVGTVTLDSFTRVGDLASVERALLAGIDLNGYPIVSYDTETTRAMLDGVADDGFPVQVRHGSARPVDIVRALTAAGLHATEGGPVSYCLPYGRTPLDESVRNWAAACEEAQASREFGVEPHLETFGGCMMGQLCPPSQLVAISVLEAMFFRQHGIRSVSVSYAQQTSMAQDVDAIAALRRLCALLLPDVAWHVVVYAYMGMYPRTVTGARTLLARAAELAVTTGAERLIVKTVAEAARIPTVAENVEALELAAAVAAGVARPSADGAPFHRGQVFAEAFALVDAVLNCAPDIGRALVVAFKRGLLDVPYCVHPDNAGRTRSVIDADGTLRWAALGALPLTGIAPTTGGRAVTSSDLMDALSHVRRALDAPPVETRPVRQLESTSGEPS